MLVLRFVFVRLCGRFHEPESKQRDPQSHGLGTEAVEWKWNVVAHGDAREEKWRGKRRMEWVAKQASFWLGTDHPVLLQSFSPDTHSKKASTRLNWHPRRYKWTRPFRWKTESGFCACAITFRSHSTTETDWPMGNAVRITQGIERPVSHGRARRTRAVWTQLKICDSHIGGGS